MVATSSISYLQGRVGRCPQLGAYDPFSRITNELEFSYMSHLFRFVALLSMLFSMACQAPKEPAPEYSTHLFKNPAEAEAPSTICPGYGITGLVVIGRDLSKDKKSKGVQSYQLLDGSPAVDKRTGGRSPAYWFEEHQVAVERVTRKSRGRVDHAVTYSAKLRTREGLGVDSTRGEVEEALGEKGHRRVLKERPTVLAWCPQEVASALSFEDHGYTFYFAEKEPDSQAKVVALGVGKGAPAKVYQFRDRPVEFYTKKGSDWVLNGISLRDSREVVAARYDVGSQAEATVSTPEGAVTVTFRKGRVAEIRGTVLTQDGRTLARSGDSAQLVAWGLTGKTSDYPMLKTNHSEGSHHITRAWTPDRSWLNVKFGGGKVLGINLLDPDNR